MCTAHGESARAARSAGPRAEPCSDELSAPRLSQQESPHGREQFLGFVGTVTFSRGKGSARGAGAVARRPPGDAVGALLSSPFLHESATVFDI